MYRGLAFMIILCLPCAASAGMYKCKDASGHATYSDTPCPTSATNQTNPSKPQTQNTQLQPNEPLVKEAYTKETPALQTSDAATKSCFNFVNTTASYPDPSSSKLLASRKKWVSVKDIGARQMVTIEITSKNTAGMYIGKQSYDCLLMGDGVTVNTKPFELL